MHQRYLLILCPYPTEAAPSQRFRFEQYLKHLNKNGIKVNQVPFLTVSGWSILYKDGKLLHKIYHIIWGLIRRLILLGSLNRYNWILIHREAMPIGPPVLEWLIAKVFSKKIIYDFDDAIWMKDPAEKGGLLAKMKWKSKVAAICKWSAVVSVGNQFLSDYSNKWNKNTIINPTTIDCKKYHNPSLFSASKSKQKLIIGWTGSHSTLPYLDLIVPTLLKLETKYNFTFRVIANKNPELSLKSFEFIHWNKVTEIEDLMEIDIGIMPLSDDDWSKGKCGFKLLQYMALSKPSLASKVGVNISIIKNGKNGYLCESNTDWYEKLEHLIINPKLRIQLGSKGRKEVVDNYSIASNEANFLSLFE